MNLNEQKNKYRTLEDWFETPQGIYASAAFTSILSSYVDQLKGATLLQIGAGFDSPWLDMLSFRRKWVVSPCTDSAHSNLVAKPLALPFERNSMDCLIAPFGIEAQGVEKSPLDEFDRILKPMGHLVLWGINPLSFWGLCLRMHGLDFFGDQTATLMSPFVVRQALVRRGFRHCAMNTFYYIPPFKNERFIQHLKFLNEIGKMIAPMPAGFYCLIVQKYQESPIGLQRSRRFRFRLPEQGVLQGGASWRK